MQEDHIQHTQGQLATKSTLNDEVLIEAFHETHPNTVFVENTESLKNRKADVFPD